MKHDDLIEPIEKFGFKDPLRFIENLVAHRIVIVSLSRCTESHYRLLLQQLSADVRVMMMIVFRKSIFRPNESVILPSSKICKRRCITSGCAFSISSKRTTEYGRRRTASESCPPSS